MAKPRAKTIIERHGFKDPDLRTAAHDDLVVWLYRHPERVLARLWKSFKGEWGTLNRTRAKKAQQDIRAIINYTESFYLKCLEHIEAGESSYRGMSEKNIRDALKAVRSFSVPRELPTCPGAKIISKALEQPIKDRNYIIGFIDMILEVSVPVIEAGYATKSVAKGRIIIGEPTLVVEFYPSTIFVEVKTKIPSIGELLRQINMYRTYVGRRASWIVFSPQEVHREILDEEGVSLITPDDVADKSEHEEE